MSDGSPRGAGLDEIIAHKRADVLARRGTVPLALLERRAGERSPARPFEAALRRRPGEGVRAIAELKRASPSRGPIRPGADAVAIARAYAAAGASAVSVLTEARWFLGSDADLQSVSGAVTLPVLRKDFVIDEYQVIEARAMGADAVLLLAALEADGAGLRRLIDTARAAGIAALVEVHDEGELSRALDAGARIVGINNRDLRTLEIDPTRALSLLPGIPAGIVRVAESGISSRAAVLEVEEAGADAILVGEALMASSDPGLALRSLLGSAADSQRRSSTSR